MGDTAIPATMPVGETKVGHARWTDHWQVKVMAALLVAGGSVGMALVGWGANRLIDHDNKLSRYDEKFTSIEKKLDKIDDKLDALKK